VHEDFSFWDPRGRRFSRGDFICSQEISVLNIICLQLHFHIKSYQIPKRGKTKKTLQLGVTDQRGRSIVFTCVRDIHLANRSQ